MKAFELTKDGLHPKGTICYPFAGHDYGLASDDTRATGREHRSFTTKQFGRGPSFTHPVADMREIEVEALAPPDQEHVTTVCKIGQHSECCRYLTMGANGWSCEKLAPAGDALDRNVTSMTAQADNCEGRASR